LLLVFFLLTTHFIEEDGIGVRLPSAASTTVREKDEVAVAITRDGRYFIAGQQLPLARVEETLRGRLKPDTIVVIRGDRDVPLQTAVSVMERVKKAGANRIVVATLEEAGAS
jgi:biopolymer transport protein ExbD